jgi:hypothetical protein
VRKYLLAIALFLWGMMSGSALTSLLHPRPQTLPDGFPTEFTIRKPWANGTPPFVQPLRAVRFAPVNGTPVELVPARGSQFWCIDTPTYSIYAEPVMP